MVWKRWKDITKFSDASQEKDKENLEQFVTTLKDCKIRTELVCTQGRMTRYVQILEIVGDELFKAKPLWVFKDEIVSFITGKWNKFVERVPEKYKNSYMNEEPNYEDRIRVRKMITCLLKKSLNGFIGA